MCREGWYRCRCAGRVNEQGWEVVMTYFLCYPTDKRGGWIIDSRWQARLCWSWGDQ